MSTAIAEQPEQVIAAVMAGAGKRVDELESAMRQLPQVDIPPVHHFAKGIYAREIFIKAGTLLTGKVHRTEHLNIISQGCIAVWTEEEGVQRIRAPFTFAAKPGTRRVGFVLEDTVWTTIHGTDETDLGKLEQNLIEQREPAVTGETTPCLG